MVVCPARNPGSPPAFPRLQQEVHDMVWEVDDRSTGVIKLDQIRTVLKRLQKSKKRMPGTGTNLLRTLIEFMMFDRSVTVSSCKLHLNPLTQAVAGQ